MKENNGKVYISNELQNNNMLPSDPLGSLDDSLPFQETVALIDANFLSKLSRYFGGGKYLKYDIFKFIERLCNKEKLICKKIFYYTAPPFQSGNPSSQEKIRKDKYDSFTQKISNNDLMIVREGRCQKIINPNGRITFSQKGVDTLMTMDLMSIPLLYENIRKIILIASDSDFVPVIAKLDDFSIKVILYTFFTKKRNTNFSRSSHLINSVYKYVKITKEDFENSPLSKKIKNENKI